LTQLSRFDQLDVNVFHLRLKTVEYAEAWQTVSTPIQEIPMSFVRSVLAMAAAIAASSAVAQVSTYPPARTFPNENLALSSEALNKARELAGDDLYPFFAQRCILDQAYPILDDLMQERGLVLPTKVFDDLYFVGTNSVSAWLVKTSVGYIVFDTLNNADEAENILIAGMRALGLNPAELRYAVITHEHGDHYNGLKYLQDTYGVQGVASNIAWNSMANGAPNRPVRNITVGDGELWTVGGKTFQFVQTPGHTNGALSTIIPLTDYGKQHKAALYGGFGIPGSVTGKVTQINSLRKFETFTQAAGVDVILGNHQVQDQSLYKMDIVRHRRCDANGCQDPNPFVIDKAVPGKGQPAPASMRAYSRFLQMQEQCIRVSAARGGQVLPF
jgi:metallo-beta-lactamase class B